MNNQRVLVTDQLLKIKYVTSASKTQLYHAKIPDFVNFD